ncbi:MAG: DUF3168 domain-containing protein [Pseudomonadota bacterium]
MAATDSSLEVQKAVVAAVRADGNLSAIIGTRIYDRVPDAAQFPYVQYMEATGLPAVETQDGEGFELGVTLSIWSRTDAGQVEAHRIAGHLVDLLNNSTLALDTKTVVMTRLLGQSTRRPDAITVQILQRWQFITDG